MNEKGIAAIAALLLAHLQLHKGETRRLMHDAMDSVFCAITNLLTQLVDLASEERERRHIRFVRGEINRVARMVLGNCRGEFAATAAMILPPGSTRDDPRWTPIFVLTAELEPSSASWLRMHETPDRTGWRIQDVSKVCANQNVYALMRDATGFIRGIVTPRGHFRPLELERVITKIAS